MKRRVTESKCADIRRDLMFLRLPLGSARRFAALLLLMGIMLGGGVDAIACEPSTEMAEISAAEAKQGDHQQPRGNERHGDCVHGHCHHGVSYVQAVAGAAGFLIAPVEHRQSGEPRLASITSNSLKRPPRA